MNEILQSLFSHIKMTKSDLGSFILIGIVVFLHLSIIEIFNFPILDEKIFYGLASELKNGQDDNPNQLNGLSVLVYPFESIIEYRYVILLFGITFLFFSNRVVRNFTDDKRALLFTALMICSTTIFSHSSLFLRDMPVMALGFLGIYLYQRNKMFLSFAVIGVSVIIKETAFLFFLFVILHYIFSKDKQNMKKFASSIRNFVFLKKPFFLILVFCASFLIPLLAYDNLVEVQDSFGNPVKNPVRHFMIVFTEGYYNLDISEKTFSFLDLLTFEFSNSVHYAENDNIRIQSLMEFWFFPAFWISVIFVGYCFVRKKPNPVIIGFISFMIPYIIISMSRDVFSYYLIYYLPFMVMSCLFVKPKITMPLMIGLSLVQFVMNFPIRIV